MTLTSVHKRLDLQLQEKFFPCSLNKQKSLSHKNFLVSFSNLEIWDITLLCIRRGFTSFHHSSSNGVFVDTVYAWRLFLFYRQSPSALTSSLHCYGEDVSNLCRLSSAPLWNPKTESTIVLILWTLVNPVTGQNWSLWDIHEEVGYSLQHEAGRFLSLPSLNNATCFWWKLNPKGWNRTSNYNGLDGRWGTQVYFDLHPFLLFIYSSAH